MTQTAVKERGIIFSTDMVKAILEGRKAQTRRVIKPQPRHYPDSLAEWCYSSGKKSSICLDIPPNIWLKEQCPYGQVGDRLWVKETWRIESFMEGEPLLFGYKDGQRIEENEYSDTPTYESWYERIVLQSTEDAKKAFSKGIIRQDDDGYTYRWKIGKSPCRWRSPRSMPLWASRILLKITSLRAERLQDITEEDAKAEGAESYYTLPGGKTTARYHFSALWDSLNAKRGYGWEENPWVWVISFKLI